MPSRMCPRSRQLAFGPCQAVVPHPRPPRPAADLSPLSWSYVPGAPPSKIAGRARKPTTPKHGRPTHD